jgi:hypothetical protein
MIPAAKEDLLPSLCRGGFPLSVELGKPGLPMLVVLGSQGALLPSSPTWNCQKGLKAGAERQEMLTCKSRGASLSMVIRGRSSIETDIMMCFASSWSFFIGIYILVELTGVVPARTDCIHTSTCSHCPWLQRTWKDLRGFFDLFRASRDYFISWTGWQFSWNPL